MPASTPIQTPLGKARAHHKITREQLATRSGLDVASINNYETGGTQLSEVAADMIGLVLDVNPLWLLFGCHINTPPNYLCTGDSDKGLWQDMSSSKLWTDATSKSMKNVADAIQKWVMSLTDDALSHQKILQLAVELDVFERKFRVKHLPSSHPNGSIAIDTPQKLSRSLLCQCGISPEVLTPPRGRRRTKPRTASARPARMIPAAKTATQKLKRAVKSSVSHDQKASNPGGKKKNLKSVKR
jgi:transcriptional regulator with XRE-family HTH domain